jgi:phosphatidylinositol alpha-1,6-mannosyltransferase
VGPAVGIPARNGLKDASNLHLLALVTDAFGGQGGIAQYNRDLLIALGDFETCNRIVVLPRHGRANPSELPTGVNQLAPAGKYGFILAAVRAAIAEGPFDVVFCGHVHLAPLAATLGALLGRPLWIQLHGTEAWGPLTRAQRWAAERAALITAVSRYTRRQFLAISSIDPTRVRVLPNTVDRRFTPRQKPKYLLERFGLREKKVLLTVGRLAAAERGKGHDRVLETLPELLKTHPDLVYLVIGEGDDRERLQALARQGGLMDAVVFAGYIVPDELPDYYRLADVFVMPSTQEGFGIVFLEAAASGLAVIGGNRDGAVDALGDGAIGRSIDPLDGIQLIEAIRAALAEPGADPARVRRFRFDNFADYLRGLISAHLLRPSITAAGRAAAIE